MSDKASYFYKCPDQCDDTYYHIETVFSEKFLNLIAADAAKDYHSHDYEPDIFPLLISIHRIEGGESLGEYSVSIEYQPHFHASKVDQRANK